MTDDERTSRERDDEFLRLFLGHERRLFAFILSLVPDWNDAGDILQETSSKLWETFDRFEPGTDFAAWAMTVARYKVLEHRKAHARRTRRFSERSFEEIARELQLRRPDEDRRLGALRSCLAELDETDRDLLRRRYAPGATTRSVAESLGRSSNAVYKTLGRVHRELLFRVRRALAPEGR